jgi:hypothetical protein
MESENMAIYDDLKGKISLTGQSAVSKVKDLSETVRLTGTISEVESEINELYKKIGYETYVAHLNDSVPETEELISQVSALHQRIEDMKAQMQAIQTANTCPNCGSKTKMGMLFCSNCGFKLPEPVAEEHPGFCKNCGAPIVKGAQVCTSCGTPLK